MNQRWKQGNETRGNVRFVVKYPRLLEMGVTLVEALITLLVMSVGLLGIAALQVVGTQENASGLRHSQAIWLAYDMADRIRANLVGVEGNAYDNIDTSTLPASPATCGAGAICSPQEIAAMDSSVWGLALHRLPGGFGTVTVDGGNPKRFLIRVRWQDDAANLATVSPHRVSTGCPSDPTVTDTCVEIWVQP